MNSPVNPLHVSRFLQEYDDAAARKGIMLSVGFDFHKYISITRNTPTKSPTIRSFQPDHSPIRSGDGFWMIGIDKNDDVAVLQAVRLYDLSCSSFAEHLENVFCVDLAPQGGFTCVAPNAKKITGKVVYHGDGWVRRDYRGQGMPEIMGGVAFGVAFAMWAPDFVCGLLDRLLVDKGLVAKYGYAHCESGGLRRIEQNNLDEHFLTWLTGEELRRRIDGHDRAKLFSAE